MTFLKIFWTLYIEMVPYLAFGLFVSGILHVTVNKSFIINHFGKKGFLSAVKAAFLGVPLPLCSCSVVPTALSLKKHGASNGATISFLISTPQTGVESIAATWGMMGPLFALFRPFAAFITGIVGGVVTTTIAEETSSEAESKKETTVIQRTLSEKFQELIRYGFRELLDDIGLNLLVGIVISALITLLVPDDFFGSFAGNTLVAMFLMIIAGAPLYICSTASIPIAASLMMKGISPAAAFVFLIVGPATNAATITVITSKLGKKIGIINNSVA